MSHHVGVPVTGRSRKDGLYVDYRHPLVPIIRRINAATIEGKPPRPADQALVDQWARLRSSEACPFPPPPGGQCPGHGPAEPGPYRHPRYVPPDETSAPALFATDSSGRMT